MCCCKWKLCFKILMKLVAAYRPVITLDPAPTTNHCLLEGQRITMTCKIKYNGTNLMPMRMHWASRASHSSYNDTGTVNMSSIFETSLTVTATLGSTCYYYICYASFLSPTGIVIRGVQRQYDNDPSSFLSTTIYPFQRVAGAF